MELCVLIVEILNCMGIIIKEFFKIKVLFFIYIGFYSNLLKMYEMIFKYIYENNIKI